MKRKTIKIILVSIVTVLLILTAVLCFKGCSCAKLDHMNYKGHAYTPAPGYEAVRTKWPIGIENGYFMFALANDPETKFIDPQNGLKLPRYLLVRDDVVLPSISRDAIERISVETPSGRMMDMGQDAKDRFVDLLQNDDGRIYGDSAHEKAYQVRFYFADLPQIYYATWMYQKGSDYSLLLENGETIVIPDIGALAELGF